MKSFFKEYPKAKPLWKVGNQHFLYAFKVRAHEHAVKTGQEIEEVLPPKPSKEAVNKKEDATK